MISSNLFSGRRSILPICSQAEEEFGLAGFFRPSRDPLFDLFFRDIKSPNNSQIFLSVMFKQAIAQAE